MSALVDVAARKIWDSRETIERRNGNKNRHPGKGVLKDSNAMSSFSSGTLSVADLNCFRVQGAVFGRPHEVHPA
ncbi:hypothetical protein [Actimicrobium sp. CCI2.3]|uniref:hypothetical protein n=1 Tax=Actimicrobium sp. CCI2.3 TaxID=3048616 RepID=UPI002AB4E17F|nr:hypothetical protein [Actimicrobium sp. CCI2.3]MDY7574224.1 hypothetical protein [Actimicrobium sp. CCI2.3]MEB0022776.1 hypothetical protein [Actimicrobium sp. CCI2.3]